MRRAGAAGDGRAAAPRDRRPPRCSASASRPPARSFSTSRSGSASSAPPSPRATASCSRSPPARSFPQGRRRRVADIVRRRGRRVRRRRVLAWGGVELVRDRARGRHDDRRRHSGLGRAARAAGRVRADRRASGLARPGPAWTDRLAASAGLAVGRRARCASPQLRRRPRRVARAGVIVARGRARRADLRDSRRRRGRAVHERRHHAGGDSDRNLLAQRLADAARDPALHARRLPARRRAAPRSGCCACSARWFGWIPGGTAVVCAVLCSFFTVFTGGSGVTILALGGVLFPALLKDGYRERFALGLLTASGSLGLLLPPALPLILYGVVAQIPIEDLFIGGILPGHPADDDGGGVGRARGHRVRRRAAAVPTRRKRLRVDVGREVGAGDAGWWCSSRCSAASRPRSRRRR